MSTNIDALREALEAVKPFEKLFTDANSIGKSSKTNIDAQISISDLRRLAYVMSDLRESLAASKPEHMPVAHELAAEQAKVDSSVTTEYLAWLESLYPERNGVGGNEAWNAGVAWARATPAGKPEPQTQAGEPEVVGWIRLWAFNKEKPKKEKNERGKWAWPTRFKFLPVTQSQCARDDLALIILQAHREAMADMYQKAVARQKSLDHANEANAKKDVALKACVEALNKAGGHFVGTRFGLEIDAAITKAEEARK